MEERVDWSWELNEHFVNTVRTIASNLGKSAIVTIDGEDYAYPIAKTVVRDGFFKWYVEIEDEPFGNIEKAVIVNENNIPILSGEGIIEKGDDGWHLAFKIYITPKVENDEVEGDD